MHENANASTPTNLLWSVCAYICSRVFAIVSVYRSVFCSACSSFYFYFIQKSSSTRGHVLRAACFFVLHVSISFHLEIRLRSGRHFGEPCALLYTFPFKQILFVQQCPNAWGRFFERSFFLVLHVSHFFSFREPSPLGSSFWAALSFVLHISLFPISFP